MATVEKVKVNAVLNMGLVDGVMKTKNMSIGSLSADRYNDDKAMAILDKVGPVIQPDINARQKVVTSAMD